MPQTIGEWNKLDTSISQAPSYSVFHKTLLDFIRPTANSTFENINLNIIFKIHCTLCALVPLKQKTSITFLCAAKIFLINEMFFLMTLIQLTRIFWKWMRMWLCKSYYLVINVFLKIWIIGLLHPQFVSLETEKNLMNRFFLERNLFYIFSRRE